MYVLSIVNFYLGAFSNRFENVEFNLSLILEPNIISNLQLSFVRIFTYFPILGNFTISRVLNVGRDMYGQSYRHLHNIIMLLCYIAVYGEK